MMKKLFTFNTRLLSRVLAFVCALSFAMPTLPTQESLMSRVKNYFSPAVMENITAFLYKQRWAIAVGALTYLAVVWVERSKKLKMIPNYNFSIQQEEERRHICAFDEFQRRMHSLQGAITREEIEALFSAYPNNRVGL